VAWGDTLEEAIKKVSEIANSVEADEYKFDDACFGPAHEAIKSGEKFDIMF
jgi:hypothetical protein